jgi:hypothetical protein
MSIRSIEIPMRVTAAEGNRSEGEQSNATAAHTQKKRENKGERERETEGAAAEGFLSFRGASRLCTDALKKKHRIHEKPVWLRHTVKAALKLCGRSSQEWMCG